MQVAPTCLTAMRPAVLPGESEVVHPGDAEHGVVDAVTFEAAAAENLSGLHAGEDMLDTGADVLVRLVVFLFPVREFAVAALAAVQDYDSSRVSAIGDSEGLADGGLGA